MCIYIYIYIYTYVSIYPSIHLSIHPSIHLSMRLSEVLETCGPGLLFLPLSQDRRWAPASYCVDYFNVEMQIHNSLQALSSLMKHTW